jgi:hypothetical protein
MGSLAYNCIMLAAAVLAFAVSLWLVRSGRLFREGVDGTFLFTVGVTTGSIFLWVPLLSIREGLLRDVKELWQEGSGRAPKLWADAQSSWNHSLTTRRISSWAQATANGLRG